MRITAAPARRAAAVAIVAVAAVAASCTPPPPTEPGIPDGEQMVVVDQVDGFVRPWDVQFTPDGAALVTERGGTLSVVQGGVRSEVDQVPDVRAVGEGGLMGLAVDPGFATNRWIYTCQTTDVDVRVVRHTVAPGYDALADPTPVVTGIDDNGGFRHQGCRVLFGPDGDLWVATGDASRGTNPQDPTSLAGKVLRLSADGTPSPTNPGVADPGSGWHPLVHTIGHRNPQGLAVRGADDAVVNVEHGTSCDDEINLVQAGANYGWDPDGAGGTYDESVPMTSAGATEPLWASGCPTLATAGGTFLDDPLWGDRQGRFVVATLKGRALYLYDLDGAPPVPVERVLWGHGRLRSVTVGPDGTLWVTVDSDTGSLLAVAPA